MPTAQHKLVALRPAVSPRLCEIDFQLNLFCLLKTKVKTLKISGAFPERVCSYLPADQTSFVALHALDVKHLIAFASESLTTTYASPANTVL